MGILGGGKMSQGVEVIVGLTGRFSEERRR